MQKIELNPAVTLQIEKAIEAASYLWEREWAERNGGNISLNLTDIIGDLPEELSDFPYVADKTAPADAAGKVFFVTGTGERLRELHRPSVTSCIVCYDDGARGFHVLWGGNNQPDFRPTSEFISHVKIHLDKLAEGSDHRCVLHTHPIELICITHHPEFSLDEELLNNSLWSMLPEVRVFIPRGIGIAPYSLPGSELLADDTVKVLRNRDVALWEKHGAVSTGRDALEAFDFIDVANKGAMIYLKCLASGFVPQGMSTDQMEELVRAFDL